MGKLRFLIPLAIFGVLSAFFIMQLNNVKEGNDPRTLKSVLIDRPVPDFKMDELPGRGMPLHSDHLKGEVTVVNLFGSWCVACLAEHPYLMEIKKRGDVPIHGIDWRDDPVQGYNWLKKHGDPYTRVGADPNSHVSIAFGVTGAPESFIVDKNGIIRYKHIGPINHEVWTTTLMPIIEELRKQ